MDILTKRYECEEKDIKVKYDETKERWKPVSSYIFIDKKGQTVSTAWKRSENDEIRYYNGNCFHYNEQAKEALLKGLVSGLEIKTENEE